MKRILLLSLPLYFSMHTGVAQWWARDNATNNNSSQSHSIGIGVKAGLNFANVTNASSISASNNTGFNVGVFLAPPSKSIIGSTTELLFSRQGYNYATGTQTGSVNLDYLILQQLMDINITKYFQIQLGGQFAYLLNAKADSSQSYNTGNAEANAILGFYNRFEYGFGGGVEVHPFKGLLLGARYNISLNNLYKEPTSFPSGSTPPSFIPSTSSIDLKNNVVMLYAGYRF
jgi:hypothetical protein